MVAICLGLNGIMLGVLGMALLYQDMHCVIIVCKH